MSELRLLALETSSPTATIALGLGETVRERTIATPREQTDLVLSLVDELLAEARIGLRELDAIVFGRGPGSFTGLRVAAAVAQGLSFASSVPIVGVSSLAALAQAGFERASPAAPEVEMALCCIDARMGELYSASFTLSDGMARAATDERIGRPESLVAPEHRFIAVGDGFAGDDPAIAGVIAVATGVDRCAVPGARQLLRLAVAEVEGRRFLPPETALPVYLRGSDAWRS